MNVSMQGVQGQGQMQRPQPPSSDQMASNMASAVSNGDITIEELQENLSERLDVEDTSSIVAEDGTVDVEELSSLLEANKPSGAEGGRPPPPPGGGGQGGPGGAGGSDMTELLTSILGEEGLEEVTEDDGSYDVDELVTALRDQLEATDQSTSGNLLDLVA